MKKKDAPTAVGTEALNRRQLRAIQLRLEVFLDQPPADRVKRCTQQQFGVYDEDEKFVDAIMADGKFFTESELYNKIMALFDTERTIRS